MKNIEIEYRAFFDKDVYDEVIIFLKNEAKFLGKDNRRSVMYITETGMVKVTEYISKGTAKISLKVGKIGSTSEFDESELEIPTDSIPFFEQVFDSMKSDHAQIMEQTRDNFELDGVEMAVKYTPSWGYHAEFEIVVDDESKKEAAIDKIHAVAEKVGVRLMTDKEMEEFIIEHRKHEKRK